jgi:hypothetical protein
MGKARKRNLWTRRMQDKSPAAVKNAARQETCHLSRLHVDTEYTVCQHMRKMIMIFAIYPNVISIKTFKKG